MVKGQCTLNIKNKVESITGYDSIEASDDVIKLLNGLKELTFNMHEVQYGYSRLDQIADCQSVDHPLPFTIYASRDSATSAGTYIQCQ